MGVWRERERERALRRVGKEAKAFGVTSNGQRERRERERGRERERQESE